MAEVLARGISSISDLLYDHLGFSGTDVANNGDRLNRFIKYFASLKSKHDEQLFAQAQIEGSKLILNQPSHSLTKKHDELLLLSFLHVVGHDVSFAFIHAINLAQQGDLMAKRTGYLMCSIFFNESHQFALLLINTILKDLQNPAVANECTALVATSQLVADGNLQTILPYVTKKLSHRVPILRKKALQCLYTMILKDPSLIVQVESNLFNCLKDPDPGVVWAAVEIYLTVSKHDPGSYRHLVKPLGKMIELVVGGRLSKAYDYHGNPSPWFLMSLVRFIALLSQGCQRSTEETSLVFLKLLEQTKTSHRVGFAVLFEVIRSIASLDFISEELFEQVSKSVRSFLSSQSLYLKLTGIRLLTMLIPRKPASALHFQSFILDVMRCSESSLLHATIDLLFVMANKSNKEFVCQKILELTDIVRDAWPRDPQVLGGIYQGLLELATRFFKDDASWFFATAFQIAEKVDKAHVSLNFEPRILNKFFAKNDKDWFSESRKKAVELAVEQLSLIKPQVDPNGFTSLLSLQLLVEFRTSAELPADILSTAFNNLLPLVATDNDSGKRILSSLILLLPNVPDSTQKLLRDSVDELLLGRIPIEPFCKLNLIELKILLSKENGDCRPRSKEESIDQQLDTVFSTMDEYVSQYLESGGMPYTRPEIKGRKIPKMSKETIRESSDPGVGEITSLEVDNQEVVSLDAGIRERDELKFSKNASVWSESGCHQESLSNQSKHQHTSIPENSNKRSSDDELTKLTRQLFVGF